jgi:hypothetical protein
VKKLDLKGNRREVKEEAVEKALQFFYGKMAHGGPVKEKGHPRK